MTNKLEISRELAELLANGDLLGTRISDARQELRSLLIAAPVVERQEAAKISIDRPWKDYPLGTKAVAVGGGHWVKNINGWKWFCGSTFPTPGGDARWVILPEDEQPAPVAAPHTMKSVMKAVCAAHNFPMLTSNQCQSLADALNEGVDKVKELNQ